MPVGGTKILVPKPCDKPWLEVVAGVWCASNVSRVITQVAGPPSCQRGSVVNGYRLVSHRIFSSLQDQTQGAHALSSFPGPMISATDVVSTDVVEPLGI